MARIAEVDVAAPIVAWLRAGGWDVYQEVRAYGGQADIIAVRVPLVWCVETKVRASADVLEQAVRWRAWAHYLAIGVPWDGHHGVRMAYKPFVERYGVGVIKVRMPGAGRAYLPPQPEQRVEVTIQPRLHRTNFAAKLCKQLYEEQREFCMAGSPSGSAWSPYKATCQYLADLVAKHPGCTLREAICGQKDADGVKGWPGVRHHYCTEATAISSLRVWIAEGKVPGVRMEREGRVLRLFPY